MPKFKLDKLVRDNLRNIYASIGQKAKYRKLTLDGHKSQLVRKIIEEVQEIQISDPISDITDEIADIRQVLDDLMGLYGISELDVKTTQQKTYDKKGGFSEGTYVETLELAGDDKWVEYYRKRPDLFPEIK